MAIFRKLGRDRRGTTAMEYGVIAALVSVAAAGVLTSMGVSLRSLYSSANTPVAQAATVGN